MVFMSNLPWVYCSLQHHYVYGQTITKVGMHLGNLTVTVTETMESNRFLCYVYFIYGSSVAPWTGTLTDSFIHLRHVLRASSERGDVDTALMAKSTECLYLFLTRVNISIVLKEINYTIRLCRLHRRQEVIIHLNILAQFCECSSSKASNVAQLTGTYLDYDSALKAGADRKYGRLVIFLLLFPLELAYLFGNYDQLNTIKDNLDQVLREGDAYAIIVRKTQLQGLVAITLARHGIDVNKNVQCAKTSIKRLKYWTKLSKSFSEPKLFLLEAELLSLKKHTATKAGVMNRVPVDGLYMKAIESAEKSALVCDMAYSYERLADYQYSVGETEMAMVSYEKAKDLYEQWGVYAKVQQLDQFLTTLHE